MNAEPWVTAIEVAQHLGVVKDTVYRWRERKGLAARYLDDMIWPKPIPSKGAQA